MSNDISEQVAIAVHQSGLKRLTSRHLRMVELELAGVSSRTDLAIALGMTPENVTLIRKSGFYQDELSRRRTEQLKLSDQTTAVQKHQLGQIIMNAAQKAEQAMVDLVDSEDDKTKFSAAKDILDRNGIGRGAAAPVTHISIEKLQLLVTAMKESDQLKLTV